ncbi:MAG: sodium:calcium antiporter [Candidatus Pacebacteria bacterium]|nr:sodium:calcium antiporter [Candidatus Paceibacterota bacterium]
MISCFFAIAVSFLFHTLLGNIIVLIGSFAILFFSSNFLVSALTKISKFLGWKEFVVSFFIMAVATTIPNFFVDITAALKGIPKLALSDVVGTNIADLTLIVALSALVSVKGLSVPSRTVQGSSIFTIGVAILPLLLMLDGNLSRLDGIILLSAFAAYMFWLFIKEDRFKKTYDGISEKMTLKFFFKNLFLFIFSISLLLLSSQGIVSSTVYFSESFHLPLALIGILIVGLGTALPESSFTLQAARKGQDWMVAGDVMGSVIMTTTLVLGVVVLISPIATADIAPFAVGRLFLAISAVFFLFCIRTGHKITKSEAFLLLLIYFAFVAVEIITI